MKALLLIALIGLTGCVDAYGRVDPLRTGLAAGGAGALIGVVAASAATPRYGYGGYGYGYNPTPAYGYSYIAPPTYWRPSVGYPRYGYGY